MELFKFGGNELKVNILKLFNNTVDRNNVPQEWETGIVINIHKQERQCTYNVTLRSIQETTVAIEKY
jgi:hypothetical protein